MAERTSSGPHCSPARASAACTRSHFPALAPFPVQGILLNPCREDAGHLSARPWGTCRQDFRRLGRILSGRDRADPRLCRQPGEPLALARASQHEQRALPEVQLPPPRPGHCQVPADDPRAFCKPLAVKPVLADHSPTGSFFMLGCHTPATPVINPSQTNKMESDQCRRRCRISASRGSIRGPP